MRSAEAGGFRDHGLQKAASEPMTSPFRPDCEVIDVDLLGDPPEGAKPCDRLVCSAKHIDEADVRPLQLAFVPLPRGRIVERRGLDGEHAVEVRRRCQPFDHDVDHARPFRSRSISGSGLRT